jgi:hypothetical protein
MVFSANWTPNKKVSLSVFAETELSGELSLENAAGAAVEKPDMTLPQFW